MPHRQLRELGMVAWIFLAQGVVFQGADRLRILQPFFQPRLLKLAARIPQLRALFCQLIGNRLFLGRSLRYVAITALVSD